MNLLLDTHVFLWWDRQDPALAEAARLAIGDPANEVFVSAASIWEIAIKRRIGKLAFGGSPTRALEANGFHAVPIVTADAEAAGMLDWSHNDPFDRMLVVQARRLACTLVSADAVIHAWFNGPVLRAG